MNAVFLLVTLDLDLEAKGAGSLEHTRQRTAHRQTRANRHGWVDRRAQVVEHLSSRPRCCAPVNNTVVRSLTHVIPSSMVVASLTTVKSRNLTQEKLKSVMSVMILFCQLSGAIRSNPVASGHIL